MLLAGTKLGRYEIRSKIGEGGRGEVYRARDEKLNRDVAIKVLPPALSTERIQLLKPASLSRFSTRTSRITDQITDTTLHRMPNVF